MIYIMSGISGIGKSTYINKIKNTKDVVISRDAIRFSLLEDGDDYFSKEDEVLKKFFNAIKTETTNYDNSYDIYIDATHLTKKARRKIFNKINTNQKANIASIYFEPDLNKALSQNKNREGLAIVPKSAIINQYNCFEIPTEDEGFCKIIKV